MSNSLAIKLGATMINASALPYDEADLVLAPGSLLLFEPGHPTNAQTGTAIPQITYNTGISSAAIQFPNIAARPAAIALAAQIATSWQITAALNSNGLMTVSSWGTCPGVHVGDELWNAAGTIQLGTFATPNAATGNPSVTPGQTLASGTYTVKRGTKPVVHRYNDSKGSDGLEKNFGYEWTPKGGLHMASSRTTMYAQIAALGVALPGAVKEYMYANQANKFFLSIWRNITAPLLAGYTGYDNYVGKNANGGYFFETGRTGTGTTTNVATPVGARNAAGMFVEQLGNTFTGTAMTSVYSDFIPLLHSGVGITNGAFGVAYGQNTSASAVVYRIYLEDLTVSGRSFATVAAKDLIAYNVAFGAGGRYAGDTYTAPATLIP